jgi:hypothetical protein
MKVLIISGGSGERWGNYLGLPKQLVPINGEVLIERTIRQLRELGVKDISIIKESDCKLFDCLDVPKLDITRRNDLHGDIDKLLSSRDYWNKEGKTILLLGDVYFTDEALKTIITHEGRDWYQYGRLGPNSITGKKWNENFAFSMYPEHHEQLYEAGVESFRLLSEKLIRRNTMAQCYRVMAGKNGSDADYRGQPQEDLGNFVVIDDLTDDWDYPKDYEEMKRIIENEN